MQLVQVNMATKPHHCMHPKDRVHILYVFQQPATILLKHSFDALWSRHVHVHALMCKYSILQLRVTASQPSTAA
jgi:hypothetical protein